MLDELAVLLCEPRWCVDAPCGPRLMPTLEFVVDDTQANRVVDTARATAPDALERITVAPVDGSPRSRITIRLRGDTLLRVMTAVMAALDEERPA